MFWLITGKKLSDVFAPRPGKPFPNELAKEVREKRAAPTYKPGSTYYRLI